MANEWEIKARSPACSATHRPFDDGETFFTLLFLENDGSFRREDLCEQAWRDRNDNFAPFSFWKSRFEAPPPPRPDTLPKESAEDILRRFIDQDDASTLNARYILAVMLERKKSFKHTDTREADSGTILIYEHAHTGEVFLIPDPHLQLDQIESVQQEVAALLGARAPTPEPVAEPAQSEVPGGQDATPHPL